MFVAAMELAPLMVKRTTGESAMGSLKVAVIVSVVPVFTGPEGE